MKNCPFCGERLSYINYTTYYDPPEWYNRCTNKKCGKFEESYFYYDGYNLKLDKWHKSGVSEEGPELKEFQLRLRYYKRQNKKQNR